MKIQNISNMERKALLLALHLLRTTEWVNKDKDLAQTADLLETQIELTYPSE